MVIAVFQALIVLLVSVLLGFEAQVGVLGMVVVCAFLALLAITAVGLGLITATVAKSSGAASGLAVIYILPMMMFGAFLAVFDDTTRAIAHFTPNFYATDALSRLFDGTPLSEGIIWQNLFILAIISLVIVVVGVQLFKKTEFR